MGDQPAVPAAPAVAPTPSAEYLAGYTVEVLGGAITDTDTESINGLPATLLQQNTTGSDAANSNAVSAFAAKGQDIYSAYADGNYPLKWNETSVQSLVDESSQAMDAATAPEGTNTVKATLDGFIVLAARGSVDAASGDRMDAATFVAGEDDATATGADIAFGTAGQYYKQHVRSAAAAGSPFGDPATFQNPFGAGMPYGAAIEEGHDPKTTQTLVFDLSNGVSGVNGQLAVPGSQNVNGGFGEFGYTTINGKVWRDHNFDGILNPGEELLAGHTLSITQWFYVPAGTKTADGLDVIELVKADLYNAATGEGTFLIDEATDKKTSDSDTRHGNGAWVSVKNAGAEGAASSFARPDSVTNEAGKYFFNQLPSYVYLATATETTGEGDDAVTITKLSVLQPNDTTTTAEANAVALDQLFMSAYRITLAEVAPIFGLTTAHVGVNVGQKDFGKDYAASGDTLESITVPATGGAALEDSDSDAERDENGKVISIKQEYFDNSFDTNKTFGQNADKDNNDYLANNRDGAAPWRADGYVIVAERGSHANQFTSGSADEDTLKATDFATYQYEQVYNGVRYDVPRPMFLQKAGDAGLVKIPRSSLTGRVWDDTGKLTYADGATDPVRDAFGNLVYDTSTGYNGVQDAGERGLANQVIYLTQWAWVPNSALEDAAAITDQTVFQDGELKNATVNGSNTSAVSGEGQWVQNVSFGADRYTSNKELLTGDADFITPNGTDELRAAADGDGKQKLYFVTKGGELVAGYNATQVKMADGTLRDRMVSVPSQDDPDTMVEVDTIVEGLKPGVLALLTSDAADTEGQWLAGQLPTAFVDDHDNYYLAAYQAELANLYGEHSNAIDDTNNSWLLTRYHENDADGTVTVEDVNGSATVMGDSDVRVESFDEATTGVAGGMIIANRVNTHTTHEGTTVQSTGVASDGTALDATDWQPQTTRNHEGLTILAHQVAMPADLADDATDEQKAAYESAKRAFEANPDAHITLPVGKGQGQTEETYDWILENVIEATPVEGDGEAAINTYAYPLVAAEAGDVGQVEAPRQSISGIIWDDLDNDGIRDLFTKRQVMETQWDATGTIATQVPKYEADGVTPVMETVPGEPGIEGIAIALERYYVVVDQQADGSYAMAADGAWTLDTSWADETSFTDYNNDAVNGLQKTIGADTFLRTTTTDADGNFSFDHLPSHAWVTVDEGDGAHTELRVYGYRTRVIDRSLWDRSLTVAKYLQGTTTATDGDGKVYEAYEVDSDLIYNSGYLMADGEYAVLLNTITEESPRTNHVKLLASGNAGQNLADRNGGIPAAVASRYGASLVDTVAATGLPTAYAPLYDRVANYEGNAANGSRSYLVVDRSEGDVSTYYYVYDLGLGANRTANDGGMRQPAQSSIAGQVFNDADYDGTTKHTETDDEGNSVVTADAGFAGKKVLLKQWYFVPATVDGWNEMAVEAAANGAGVLWVAADGSTTDNAATIDMATAQGASIQNIVFGHDYYTKAANTDLTPADAAVSSRQFVISDATYDSSFGGVWVLTDADDATDPANIKVAGNYLFDHLPSRFVEERKVDEDGHVGFATEYLAGYTVEVLGNDDSADMSMNGLPVTRVQVDANGQETTAASFATDAINSTVVSAQQNTDSRYETGNYPVRWNETTTQVEQTTTISEEGTVGEYLFTKATLDGMIILAKKATTAALDASQDLAANGATHTDYTYNATRDGKNVSFDITVGQDELRMNAGYGLFGTTTISGKIWQDANFDGLLNPGETLLADKGLRLTQWYYVRGEAVANNPGENADAIEYTVRTADGPETRYFKPAAGELVASNVIDVVYGGTTDTKGTVVGAWVQVPRNSYKLENATTANNGFGYFADTAVTDANGVYNFSGLNSFVYVEREGTGAAATTTVYQPGTKTVGNIATADNYAPLENKDNVTTDKLYLASYRITLDEVAPVFSLTTLHVGINVSNDEFTTTTDANGVKHTTVEHKTTNPSGADVAVSPEMGAGTAGDTGHTAREDALTNAAADTYADPAEARADLDSDAIRTEDGTIQMREEFFDQVNEMWRTDGYVIVADHEVAGDGHRYKQAYGSNGTGVINYDVPNPMGSQRGGNAGLVAVPRSSITGMVWNDGQLGYGNAATYNGKRDEGEQGIPDQVVYLTQWYWVPDESTADPADGQWVQNTQFGRDRYTSNRDGAYQTAGAEALVKAGDTKMVNGAPVVEPLTPILYNGNTMEPLSYVYADADGNQVDAKGNLLANGAGMTLVEGVLATTTGNLYTKDVAGEDGTLVPTEMHDQLGLYHFANLPTAYVDDNDNHYLAAYRVELADVRHTANDDGTDNQWLLTRYHVAPADGATDDEKLALIDADSDSNDVTDLGPAGGIKIKQLYLNDVNSAGTVDVDARTETRANDGQIILAARSNDASATANNGPHVLVEGASDAKPLGEAMDTTNEVIYNWTETAKLADGTPGVLGGSVGEVKAPVQKITGRIWFDDDNDGLLNEAATDTDVGTGADTMAAGMQLTLERYFTIVDTQVEDATVPTTWQRDDEWDAATFGAKSAWLADANAWAAYDADPTATLGDAAAHAKATDAAAASGMGDGVARTVTTDENGVFAFENLKTQEWVEIDGKQTLVIYGYKVRMTDNRFWNRYYGAAKLRVSGQTDAKYTYDSDLIYEDGYLMAADEYDVLLQLADANCTPVSNKKTGAGSGNANIEADEATTGPNETGFDADAFAAEVNAATRVYDLAWGIDRVSNDGGLRKPQLQSISGLLWQDASGTMQGLNTASDYNGKLDDGEKGLAGKQVILKQWFYVPATAAGFNAAVAAAEAQDPAAAILWLDNSETLATTRPDADALKGAWNPEHQLRQRQLRAGFRQRGRWRRRHPYRGARLRVPARLRRHCGAHRQRGEDTRDGFSIDPTQQLVQDGVPQFTYDDSKLGQYLFDKLPTRYVAPYQPGTVGGAAYVAGAEYLAGYTVEVLGTQGATATNGKAVEGLPASLKQQVNQPVAADRGSNALSTVNSGANLAAQLPYSDGNYGLRWNDTTAQDAWADGEGTNRKHTLNGFILLAGVAQVDDTANGIFASPHYSVVSGTTTNRGDANTEVTFDWNLGRDEQYLDGGFGAYGLGSLTGFVFQDKNVDGFYNNPTQPITPTDKADVALSGISLQIQQWFFVPDVQDADDNWMENPLVAQLEAAGYVDTTYNGDGTYNAKKLDSSDIDRITAGAAGTGTAEARVFRADRRRVGEVQELPLREYQLRGARR